MSPVPRYELIYRDLRTQIRTGTLPSGTRLPSEADLAASYQVSRMTVRQALDQLAAEHVVARRKGSGTYVTDEPPAFRQLNRLAPFHVEMGLEIDDVTTETRIQRMEDPSGDASDHLNLARGEQAVHLLRRRFIRGQPAAIQDSWLPSAVVPNLAHEPLIDGSLYTTLRTTFGIRLGWAEQAITAAIASPEQSEWLAIPPGSPVIALRRITYTDQSVPVEYSRSWTRAEYPMVIRLEP